MSLFTGEIIPVWLIVLPLITAFIIFLVGLRTGPVLTVICNAVSVVLSVILYFKVMEEGAFVYPMGGWGAPLGIDLDIGGLATLMLVATASVSFMISVFSWSYFHKDKSEKPFALKSYFWPLWLFCLGGLNTLFCSGDAFNIYVALELISFSAITLVTLSGTVDALLAATRYFFLTLVGSLLYLLGVGFLYSHYGMLDLTMLSHHVYPDIITSVAFTLMTAGVLIKAALFPMHFWLPSAHSKAPAPVSAILSGLVIMGSYFLLIRIWFDVFSRLITPIIGQLPGVLGVVAILAGSVMALRQKRIKMILAYSTVSQIGYMFLIFPLYTGNALAEGFAWNGGIYLSVSHACAKAAAFMVAGSIIFALGHDDLKGLAGLAVRYPIGVFTIALAGISLIGLPPSGGFIGKWMLLKAAMLSHQWVYAVFILLGGLLSAAYIFRILEFSLKSVPEQEPLKVPMRMQYSALVLAMIAIALGFASDIPFDLLSIDSLFILESMEGFLL